MDQAGRASKDDMPLADDPRYWRTLCRRLQPRMPRLTGHRPTWSC